MTLVSPFIFGAEQIIWILWDAEILLAEGQSVPTVNRKLGISEQSYYRWRKEYGGMKVVHAQRLKDLEKENSRLKELLAEAELDNALGARTDRGMDQHLPAPDPWI